MFLTRFTYVLTLHTQVRTPSVLFIVAGKSVKQPTLSTHLGTDEKLAYCVCVSFFFFFFFFFKFLATRFCGYWLFQWVPCTMHGTHKLLFFNKTFIKNGSHNTIHTFKNYFATVFSVFSKISGIQTHHKFLSPFLY